MPIKRHVRTPLGDFATIKQAAAAHHCEKKTITNRIATRPEEYQYVHLDVPTTPRYGNYEPRVKGVRWPITWSQYRFQEHEVKEQIYTQWCKSYNQDPNTEAAAEAFFDEMDQYQGDAETENAEDSDSTEQA